VIAKKVSYFCTKCPRSANKEEAEGTEGLGQPLPPHLGEVCLSFSRNSFLSLVILGSMIARQ
jgi:hypothetical protein